MNKKKSGGIKDYFVTGLFAVLPLALSVGLMAWIVGVAWEKFFSAFVPGVEQLIRAFFQPETAALLVAWHAHQVVGLALLLSFILAVGFIAKVYIGKSLLALVDKIIGAIPGLNFIYGTIRQFTATMDPESPQHDAFRNAVLVKFQNGYLLGFLTSHSSVLGKEFATVFIPCNQLIQGYNLMVDMKDVTPLDMKVDDALKYVISFGMVAPAAFKPALKRKK